MKTRWTSHLKDEADKKAFKEAYKASGEIRRRLIELLEEERAANNKARCDNYESPAWAMKQADHNGVERTIEKIISIISD